MLMFVAYYYLIDVATAGTLSELLLRYLLEELARTTNGIVLYNSNHQCVRFHAGQEFV